MAFKLNCPEDTKKAQALSYVAKKTVNAMVAQGLEPDDVHSVINYINGELAERTVTTTKWISDNEH